jgi:hypothetical protein
MKSPAHYHELKAACLPLITAYHADLLKHDRRLIRKNPGTPFIHVTRDYGTYIDLLFPAEKYPKPGVEIPYLFGMADRHHLLRECGSSVRYSAAHHPSATVHYFDGTTLHKIDHERALRIVNDYQIRIRREWARAANEAESSRRLRVLQGCLAPLRAV